MSSPQPRARRTAQCCLCGADKPCSDTRPVELLSPALRERIARAKPDAPPEAQACTACIRELRLGIVREALAGEKGELAAAEQEVLASLQQEELVAQDADAEFDKQLSLGERVSDRMASFGGSWAFIGSFGGIIFVWIVVNSLALLQKPFDPYPFILLNLCLSCLAALQAPVIMMSQNRQEARDRARAVNDYRINLKAEIEIRSLHAKIDMLMSHQWQRLLEIQELQMEMLADSGKN